MITSSAIGAQSPDGANAGSGYRIVQVSENAVEHRYVNITLAKSEAFQTDRMATVLLTVVNVILAMFTLR